MKIIVTHTSPDLDAIVAAWLLKKFLPGWQDAKFEFVQAGDRLHEKFQCVDVIENIDGNEVIHVDTGLGCLDHHQLPTEEESASSLTWKFIQKQINLTGEKWENRKQALDRIVQIVVEIDHFREVFWKDPTNDYYDFSFVGIIDGIKLEKPNDDRFYIEFGIISLDRVLHEVDN